MFKCNLHFLLSWKHQCSHGTDPSRDTQIPRHLCHLPGEGDRERRQAHPLRRGFSSVRRAHIQGIGETQIPGRPKTEAGEYRWRDRQGWQRRRRADCGGKKREHKQPVCVDWRVSHTANAFISNVIVLNAACLRRELWSFSTHGYSTPKRIILKTKHKSILQCWTKCTRSSYCMYQCNPIASLKYCYSNGPML